jgi:hypothetical protein
LALPPPLPLFPPALPPFVIVSVTTLGDELIVPVASCGKVLQLFTISTDAPFA